jgi:iron(III) transport system substrate-binding protein
MKKTIVLSIIAVFTLALGAGSLFAGGQGQSGGAASSGSAGKLVIYSPNSQTQVDVLIPAFEKQTGIKIELISAGTGECWKRIENERNNPNADIIWGGQVANYNADLLENYISVNDASILPQFRNVAGKITPYCLDGSVLLVNKELIGNISITGYADLLNPALKGKISMGDPTNSSSAFAQLTNMLYDFGNGDYLAPVAWDYVQKLLANVDGKIAQSSSAVYKGIADGEYTVGLTYEDPCATLVRDGADVEIIYMKEGVSFRPGCTAIIKNCKNLDNAKKWIDFIVSRETQSLIGTQLTTRPVRDDATLASYMESFSKIKLVDENQDKLTASRDPILDKYRALIAK